MQQATWLTPCVRRGAAVIRVIAGWVSCGVIFVLVSSNSNSKRKLKLRNTNKKAKQSLQKVLLLQIVMPKSPTLFLIQHVHVSLFYYKNYATTKRLHRSASGFLTLEIHRFFRSIDHAQSLFSSLVRRARNEKTLASGKCFFVSRSTD